MPGSLPRGKVFYGWWIVAASAVILTVSAGLGFYSFGVFFTPMTREFGWSRAEFSGTIAIAFLVTGIASPLAGSLTDRLGARRVIIGSAMMMGGCFAVLGLTQSLWFYYVLFVVQAAFRAGAHIVPTTTLVANWFLEKRGLAMGIVVIGISLGGVTITPLCTYLIESFGWRTAYVVLGALIWITVIPVSVTVIRNRPQEMGLLPYAGGARKGNRPLVASGGSGQGEAVWTMGAAARTSAFWLSSITVALLYMGGSSVMNHTIPLLRDRGASAEEAALVMSFIAGMGIIGKTCSGYLADRFQVRFVVVAIGLLTSLAMVLLISFSSGAMLWVFAFVFGASFGGVIAIQSILTAYCFGVASLGAIMGGAVLLPNVGLAIGPLLAGYVFDVTGSYNLAFQLFIGGCLLAALLVSFLRPPRLPEAAAVRRM